MRARDSRPGADGSRGPRRPPRAARRPDGAPALTGARRLSRRFVALSALLLALPAAATAWLLGLSLPSDVAPAVEAATAPEAPREPAPPRTPDTPARRLERLQRLERERSPELLALAEETVRLAGERHADPRVPVFALGAIARAEGGEPVLERCAQLARTDRLRRLAWALLQEKRKSKQPWRAPEPGPRVAAARPGAQAAEGAPR